VDRFAHSLTLLRDIRAILACSLRSAVDPVVVAPTVRSSN